MKLQCRKRRFSDARRRFSEARMYGASIHHEVAGVSTEGSRLGQSVDRTRVRGTHSVRRSHGIFWLSRKTEVLTHVYQQAARHKRHRFSSVVAIVLLTVVGCTSSATQNPDPANAVANEHQATVVSDRLGRTVSFEIPPRRIISLSPSTTELLFAIDAGDLIVGATEHCDFPAAANGLPRVGGGTLTSISREMIVSLEPDLVIAKWDSHEPLVKTMELLEIPILMMGADSIDDIFADARTLGGLTNHAKDAESLVDQMQSRLETLTACVRGIPDSERRTVFYEVWDDPLMTAGPNSFIGELLEIGGMKNIFADAKQRYPKISSEVAVARRPDVILAPSTHATRVSIDSLRQRQGWQDIPAIRDDAVFLIDGDQVSRCGPRVINALEEMIRTVYPNHYNASESR